MIPIQITVPTRYPAFVTWTLIALNIVIYLWDRQGHISGPSITFADLAMRPNDVFGAIRGREPSFGAARAASGAS